MDLPKGVADIIDRLNERSHEAYAVGGCVRDSLLGAPVKDWDVCTAATPDEVKACLCGYVVLETGLRHGTVTVLAEIPVEVTTFRRDGEYEDFRRPREVTFTRSLTEDLCRRDFTVNALAYNPGSGVIDLHGGIVDLRGGVLRCIGEPRERLYEDALRIMRALRFAAVYNFVIEAQTSWALHELRELLRNIAVERIAVELQKLLHGDSAAAILREYHDILCVIIPELAPMPNTPQRNKYHCYNVWEHTLRAVESAPRELRLTMLLHDVEKPSCLHIDDKGITHFHNHQRVGAETAARILRRLRLSNAAVDESVALIKHHDEKLTRANLKRWLNRLGEPMLRKLIDVMRADSSAKASPYKEQKLCDLDDISAYLDEIACECHSLHQLAINGSDLIAVGITDGKKIGATLNELLTLVIDDILPNTREALLAHVKHM